MEFDAAFGYSVLGCIAAIFCIVIIVSLVVIIRDRDQDIESDRESEYQTLAV